MKVTLWGTRGSLPSSGADTLAYGGNTSCVEIRGSDSLLVLDAGSGIQKLGFKLEDSKKDIHILLTHLHLDHIQGLGFFTPFWDKDREIHLYAPARSTTQLYVQLAKYLSPPLFPVLLKDLPCKLYLHPVFRNVFSIEEFQIECDVICHPGTTIGYRISNNEATIAYIPDHEPALGCSHFPTTGDWTSGFDIAKRCDLLIHDAQYTLAEYQYRIGWGHCAINHALRFAQLAKVNALVTFHHDTTHSDEELNLMLTNAISEESTNFEIFPGMEGSTFEITKSYGIIQKV